MTGTIKSTLLGIFCMCIIIIPVFSGEKTMKCTTSVKSGTLSYSITYDSNRQEWAEYIKEMTDTYLKTAEDFLSIPFPRGNGFVIAGRDEVYLHLKGSQLDGVRIGGYNLWDEVALEYSISPAGNPALLFHELGHYWFPDGKANWFLEGIVSYLPVAMADAGMLKLDKKEYDEILNHWGLRYTVYSKDIPLKDDFRGNDEEGRSFFYMKTFKFQYLLHRELEGSKYKNLLQEYSPKIKESTSDDLVTLLKKYKNNNWKEFLSGWVFPGKYTAPAYDDFGDPDCDSLLSVDEYYLRTNPHKVDTDRDLIPDGAELELGLDPLKASSKNEWEDIIKKHGPFVDGEKTDWEIFPCVTIDEKSDDAQESVYNMLSMSYACRDNALALYVETKTSPARRKNVMFDVLVDLDFDTKTDKEFAFNLENPSTTWTYLYSTASHWKPEGLYGALNRGCEMTIPLDEIPVGEFRILPIIRDWEKEVNFDEWDSWEYVNIKTLKEVDSYGLKTDLIKADADRDHIPDIAEITHNLNPVKKDPAGTVKKYGPFIDGMDSEWAIMKANTGSDKKSDAGKGEYDMVTMDYLIKDSSLYIMVKTRKKPDNEKGIMFDVLIDANLDNQYDLDFAFFLSAPRAPWNYSAAEGKSFFPAGLVSAMDEVMEIAIPLKAVGSVDFQILPIIRDDIHKTNFDEWSSWVRITQ